MQGGGTIAVHGDGTSWHVVGGLPAKSLPGVAVDTAGNPWLIELRAVTVEYASRLGGR